MVVELDVIEEEEVHPIVPVPADSKFLIVRVVRVVVGNGGGKVVGHLFTVGVAEVGQVGHFVGVVVEHTGHGG